MCGILHVFVCVAAIFILFFLFLFFAVKREVDKVKKEFFQENRCVVLKSIWCFEERKRIHKIYRRPFG